MQVRFLRIVLVSLFSFLVFQVAVAAKKKKRSNYIAVIDFTEHGKISRGAGKTLAIALYSSLNSSKYKLLEPSLIQQILTKNGQQKFRRLSEPTLADLKKAGVRFILTGSVSYHYRTFLVTYRLLSMKGKILHSEILPPIRDWSGVLSSVKYSVSMLTRKSSQKKKRLRVSYRKRKKKKKKKSKLKKFAKLIKKAKRMAGLFAIYKKPLLDGKFKYYLEVQPSQLGKVFLFSPTLDSGTGGSLLPYGVIDEFPFYFKREETTLYLYKKNTRFIAPRSKTRRFTYQRSFADGLLTYTKVLSQPHPKRKSFLVDLTSLFGKNLTGVKRFKISRRSYASFSTKKAKFTRIESFPNNVELTFRLFFRSKKSIAIPKATTAPVFFRYSLSKLPTGSYRPRIADDRVGHFLTVMRDFNTDRHKKKLVRYITRWNLQKKYPHKKVSVPKKPIVFWLEKNIPKEYRRYVAEGVLLWNKAFERIGFKNAVVVKQQPDKATWTGADVRYSTIRWFFAHRASFAQGPSRINPFTGEIFDADIRVAGDMMTYVDWALQFKVAPLSSGLSGLLHNFQPFQKMSSLRDVQQWLEESSKTKRKHKQHTTHCDFARGAHQQAAIGWHMLASQPGFSRKSKQAKEFWRGFIVSLIAHEVGHTLGLRHNFKASMMLTKKQLGNKALTKKVGLTNSVMEYTPVNLALPGEKQGEFWQTSLGPYDHWAIEYAYKPIAAKTPQGEKKTLEKIASKAPNANLQYGTDEDAYGPFSVDPDSTRWDLGKDALTYYGDRIKISNILWKRLETKLSKKYRYQTTFSLFKLALGGYFYASRASAKFLGGLHHVRDHVTSKQQRQPFRPVPAKKQRKAFQLILKNVFAKDTLRWSPSLLNKLAPERLRGLTWSTIWGKRVDFPVYQIVLAFRQKLLMRMLHPLVLSRIQNNSLRLEKGQDAFTISELFQGTTTSIWSEYLTSASTAPSSSSVKGKSSPTPKPARSNSSQRRAIQWFHLQFLIAYNLFQKSALRFNHDVLLSTKRELKRLKSKLSESLVGATGIDKAHLEQCVSRIKKWEKSKISRRF